MNLVGQTLGQYQILHEIGRGGMAVVYRAYQPSLNRYVAIKVLPPILAFDQEFIARFVREAQAAASLRHANIVVIHDVGQDRDLHYIVMEFLEGQTLKQVLEREGPLRPKRVAPIIDQIAAALDYAHYRGFIHRDVKPANIFVGERDHATLTDFGIAKAARGASLTRTGMLVGTPEYMSPEQAQGDEVDQRTDVYSLGVVAYEMLAGRVPFGGATPHAILHKQIYEPPPRLASVRPGLPPGVEAAVAAALRKSPAQRCATAGNLAAAISKAVCGPAPVSPPSRGGLPARRSKAPAGKAVRQPPPSTTRRVAAGPRARRSLRLPIVAAFTGLAVLAAVIVFLVLPLLAAPKPGAADMTATAAYAASTAVELPVAMPTALPSSTTSPAAAPTGGAPLWATVTLIPTRTPTAIAALTTSAPTEPAAVPTVTLIPTRTPTATPRKSATPAVTYPAPVLVSPKQQDAGSLRGTQLFEWSFAKSLKSGEGFQLLIWKQGQAENMGAAAPVTTLSDTINLDVLLPTRGGPGPYFWSVVVVRISDSRWLSPRAEPWQFTYVGPQEKPPSDTSPGGGGTRATAQPAPPPPTLEPLPTIKP